jgi:hypothetical protein
MTDDEMNAVVNRCAPRWAWVVIDELLENLGSKDNVDVDERWEAHIAMQALLHAEHLEGERLGRDQLAVMLALTGAGVGK